MDLPVGPEAAASVAAANHVAVVPGQQVAEQEQQEEKDKGSRDAWGYES